MATIFSQPNATGSGNCVVLSSQENFYAPFLSNIGNWNQIRVSAYMGLCGTSGFISPSTQESISLTSPPLGFYWGIGNFSSAIGLLTPQTVGCNFVGVSTFPLGAVSILQASSHGPGLSISKAAGVGSSLYSMVSNDLTMANGGTLNASPQFPAINGTGSGNFCVANNLVFFITGKGQTGQTMFINNNYDVSGGTTVVYNSLGDINSLRISAMNLLGTGANGQLSQQIFYTTGCVATGGPLPLPDTMYIHFPFNNNLLKIYSLVIEKYA